MLPQLSEDEVVTLKTLKQKGKTNCQIARTLGETEGAVWYQLCSASDASGVFLS